MIDHVGPSFGQLLRSYRASAKLTQQELAGRAGLSVRAVRELERGRVRVPRPRSVDRLAAALGLAADDCRRLRTACGGPGDGAAGRWIQVLGPLAVHRDGQVVDLGEGRLGSLLAVLAFQPDHPVPAERIADLLWGDRAPRTWPELVHTYVARLRRLLDPDGPRPARAALIGRSRNGYVLHAGADRLDLLGFGELAAAAEQVRESTHAYDLYAQALRCWHGPALANLDPRLRLQPAVVAAGRRRLEVALAFADLALDLGRYQEAEAALQPLVAAEPLDEALHARLIQALAGAGRRTAALQLFATVRRRLDDELGVVPGQELQAAHRQVLRDEPATLAVPAGQPAAPEPAGVVPRQLPAPAAHFVGRARELSTLTRPAPGGGDPAGAVPVTAICGVAGVGKTALAVSAAHRLAEQYPDGQIFLDLHGFTDAVAPVQPGDALDRLLRGLGVPGERVPAELDDRAALWRSLLADKRVLIVLDNAATGAQVGPLLPGTPGCLVLVTSRRRMAGLDTTHAVSLDMLPATDAVTLFARTAGKGRLAGESHELVGQTVELCGRLPLAIRIAAARLRSRPSWRVADLRERLRDQDQRLAELGDGSASVPAALELSYQHHAGDARCMYRLLSHHPGPDLDSYAAAALAGTTLVRARRLLDQLVDAHLLQEPAPDRYAFHDLVRAHAAHVAARDDPAPVRRVALTRLLDHYRHTASVAMDAAYPYERERRPQVRPAAATTPDLPDPMRGASWLDIELPNLLAVVRSAADDGWQEHAIQMPAILHRHLRVGGRYRAAETLHRLALTTARTTGDRPGVLDALIGLGWAHLMQDNNELAIGHYQQALRMIQLTGDRAAEVDALIGLGHVHRQAGRRDQAADHYERALAVARLVGNQGGEVDALVGLGYTHLVHGSLGLALDHLRPALEIARAADHRIGEQNALRGLGHVHTIQGRHEEALDNQRQALELARAYGNLMGELGALTGLGDAHRAQGQHEQAADHYRRALDLARKTGDRNWQFEALDGLGRVCHATGHPDVALTRHQQSLGLATDLRQPADEVRAHDGLAHAYRALRRPEDAGRHWRQALGILASLGTVHIDDRVSAAAIRAQLADLDT